MFQWLRIRNFSQDSDIGANKQELFLFFADIYENCFVFVMKVFRFCFVPGKRELHYFFEIVAKVKNV